MGDKKTKKDEGITGVIGDTGIYKGSIYSHKQSKQMEKAIKEYNNNIPIIAGGPHPTIDDEQFLHEVDIQACAIGEGELSMKEIM